MNTAVSHKLNRTLDGQRRPSSDLFRWAGLLLGFFLVWLFMFVIAPVIEESPAVKPLADFIEESGIDASALYYTEVEEASVAELNMRHTMEFMPTGAGKNAALQQAPD
ncbi:MAG: hypothetical protein AMK70_02960 [Nitrospira bacterium SG8_35_1]|nr:MAG: hypothetical protein AMK70_02960 [Nitrospira bacterium SG8_35_1]